MIGLGKGQDRSSYTCRTLQGMICIEIQMQDDVSIFYYEFKNCNNPIVRAYKIFIPKIFIFETHTEQLWGPDPAHR